MRDEDLASAIRPEQSISLSDKAYNMIKTAILSFVLKPGEPLIEAQIAKQINISRTPIRESLKKLESEGLVNIIPKKGAFVSDITREDIEELFVLREALERTALRAALPRFGADDFLELEEILERAKKDIENGDFETSIQGDVMLHGMIIEKSGYKRLAQFLDVLKTQALRIRYLGTTVKGRTQKSMKEHKAIMDAIKDKDLKLADSLLKEHIRNVRDNVLRAL